MNRNQLSDCICPALFFYDALLHRIRPLLQNLMDSDNFMRHRKPGSLRAFRTKEGKKLLATVEETLLRLKKSAFRSKFSLSEKDKKYISEKGMETIKKHAADFVKTRLAPADIPNDGRQTPMRGHPVFIAQHACACCCRGCLNKWYHVPIGVELTENQQERIVKLLMAWIEKQL